MIKHLWVFLIFSLIVLSGCAEEKKEPVKKVFIGGTQGVVAKFEEFGPLENNIYTIYDTEEFPVSLVLNNRGEEEIKPNDVNVKIIGLPKDSFTGLPVWEKKNTQTLEKVSEFNLIGGEETIVFGDKVKYKGKVTGFTDLKWIGEITYLYKTHIVIPDVCFKGDPTDKRICEIKEAKAFHISGAPVTVTKVEQDTAGAGLIALKIEVKNVGNGKVTKPGTDFHPHYNQISYSINEKDKWECKSGGKENEARLDATGSAVITCKLKKALAKDELYLDEVRLDLEYLYQELIQENLRIKESLK